MTETNDTATRQPLLLTPGPLTTSQRTKRAMQRDWGTRDDRFMALSARLLERLAGIAGAAKTHSAVPVQGSGTFAIEAALGTFVPRGARVLVLINGAYGRRMTQILDYAGRAYVTYETPEDTPPDPDAVAALLAGDAAISHVAAVHCETTSGILNPIEAIARVVAGAGRRFLVDAMSSFGGIAIDLGALPIDVLVASANKCLEGLPGLAFAIVRDSLLKTCEGNAHSLSLDLYDQWRVLRATGQWRFTPPTQVIAALAEALDQLDEEGGVAARHQRYSENARVLTAGMRGLGFVPLLADGLGAPIIITFKMPAAAGFHFDAFYGALKQRGFIIYPGKLTRAPSFRIGCIGAIGPADMTAAVAATAEALAAMGVASGQP